MNQLLEQKATKQFKAKVAKTKQTLPVSKRHPQLQTERDREEGRGRNEEPGKEQWRGEIGESVRRVCRKEPHSGWERGQKCSNKTSQTGVQ